MKIIKTDLQKISKKEINILANYFLRGKTVVYPTDTIYGIGCLAADAAAVGKVYAIKKRSKEKKPVILADSLPMMEKYTKISRKQKKIIKKYLRSKKTTPTTFALESREKLSFEKKYKKEGLAVRIPRNKFLIELLKKLGNPIVSTSLNISGQPNLKNLEDIESYFGKNKPNLVLDAGELSNRPSKIIDIQNPDKIKVLRK